MASEEAKKNQILEKAKKKKKMASSYESFSQSISRSQSAANMNNLLAGGGPGTQRFQRTTRSWMPFFSFFLLFPVFDFF